MWRRLNEIEFGAILFGVGFGLTCAAGLMFSGMEKYWCPNMEKYWCPNSVWTQNMLRLQIRIQATLWFELELWYGLWVVILLRLGGEKVYIYTPKESIVFNPKCQKGEPISQGKLVLLWDRSPREKNYSCNPLLKLNKTLSCSR